MAQVFLQRTKFDSDTADIMLFHVGYIICNMWFQEKFTMLFILQVIENESEMNDDFKKPNMTLLDFLKSKFLEINF